MLKKHYALQDLVSSIHFHIYEVHLASSLSQIIPYSVLGLLRTELSCPKNWHPSRGLRKLGPRSNMNCSITTELMMEQVDDGAFNRLCSSAVFSQVRHPWSALPQYKASKLWSTITGHLMINYLLGQ